MSEPFEICPTCNIRHDPKDHLIKTTGIKGHGFAIVGQGQMAPEIFDALVQGYAFWQATAEDHMKSAKTLWGIYYKNLIDQELGTNFNVVWLLVGFALENSLKALIAPDIKIEQSGKLPDELSEHRLVRLAKKTDLSLDENEIKLLEFLTEFVFGYGRYHTQTNHQRMHKNGSIFSDPMAIFTTAHKVWIKILEKQKERFGDAKPVLVQPPQSSLRRDYLRHQAITIPSPSHHRGDDFKIE